MMKKSFLIGGLLSKTIKGAYKAHRSSGGKKVTDIMKQSNVSKGTAKSDVKSELKRIIGSKKTLAMIGRDNLKNKSGTVFRKLRKQKQQEVRNLQKDINKLK